MTRLNLLIIFIAVLLIAAYSSWLLSTFKSVTQKEQTKERHISDYYLDEITATLMDARGKPRYRLTANRLDHYPDTDTIEMTQPVLKVLTKKQPGWKITSESGVILNSGDEIHLHGKVTIKQEARAKQPATYLFTRNLRIQVSNEYAETDEDVKITHDSNQLTGTGMKLYLGKSRLELLANGRGTYVVPH